MTRCLTDLELEHHLLGELATPHVDSCARCRDELVAKRAAGEAYMRSPHALALAAHLARPRRPIAVGFAGAIAMLVVITMVVWPRPVDRSAEVLTVTREWMDAYRHNDAAALDRILADDYKLTDAAGRISTKADDIAGARAKHVLIDTYDTSDVHVRVWGDTAVVTGHSVVRGAARGEPFVHDFKFTDTLARIDGRWRAVAAHVSR